MSLINAKKLKSTFIIIGDTRITNLLTKEISITTGGLIKSVIFTNTICISFAGSTYLAEDALSKNRLQTRFLKSNLIY